MPLRLGHEVQKMPRLTGARALRVGLVGLGRWGTNYVGAFDRAGVEVNAVCDLDVDRLRAVEQRVTKALVVTSFSELLKSDLDAVVIATPANTHAELSLSALASGKHVLVEKPLALNVGDAISVMEAARQAARSLMVGHLSLVSPVWRETLDRIGELRSYEAHRMSLGASHSEESALFGLASHDVASLIGPLGQTIARVRARSLDRARPDQHIALQAESTTGVVAHIRASRLGPTKLRRVTLAGATTTATVDELAADGVTAGNDPLALQCKKFAARIERGECSLDQALLGAEVVRVLAGAEASLRAGGEWTDLRS